MIKYTEGELLDVLSAPMSESADVKALSYALKMGMARMLGYAASVRMYADVMGAPGWLLDYMALEMDVPYYEESMGLDVKRGLLRNAIQWHMAAGTKGAVQGLVAAVFGEGEVTEWPDFAEGAGTPGLFDITTNAPLTLDMYARFARIIEKAKNISSHLRHITISREGGHCLHHGAAMHGYAVAPMIRQRGQFGHKAYAGAAAHGYVLASGIRQRDRGIRHGAHLAAALYGHTVAPRISQRRA